MIPYSVRMALLVDDEGNEKLNRLTPAAQKPEWQKFLEELTGFFALLLWAGTCSEWLVKV